jgi:transposase
MTTTVKFLRYYVVEIRANGQKRCLICPCGCGIMHKIGEDRSERLDIVPAQLRVIVTVRPKYACRTCTDGVTHAPKNARVLDFT